MIRIQGKLPKKIGVAVSGGVDSMAILDFLRRNHDVLVCHFNHNEPHDYDAEDVVLRYCHKHNLENRLGILDKDLPRDTSIEEHYRNHRYAFLDKIAEDNKIPILTGHHLDDCVETWVFNSIRKGYCSVIPYKRASIIRPFRLNRKSVFQQWAFDRDVPYAEDPTNSETRFDRNFIRHEIMPSVLRVNPGIHTMVMKKILCEDTK